MSKKSLPVPADRSWLSPSEVWRVYGIARSSLYRLRDAGKLKHYKIGSRVRINRADVEKLIKPAKRGA